MLRRSRVNTRAATFFAFCVLVASCVSPVDEPQLHAEFQTDEAELTRAELRGQSLPDHVVSITIDDGPNPFRTGQNTRAIADYLAEEGIAATFFVLGSRLTDTANMADWRTKRFPRITPTMHALLQHVRTVAIAQSPLHHLIANHTFSHEETLAQLPSSERAAEFINAHNLMRPYFEGDMRLLRTPYGSWTNQVYTALQQTVTGQSYVGNVRWDAGNRLHCAYSARVWDCTQPDVAGGSIDAADWECWAPGAGRPAVSPTECAKGYVAGIEAANRRGIVLMHDVRAESVTMLKALVPMLKARGYRFARVDQVPTVNAALVEKGHRPAPAVR